MMLQISRSVHAAVVADAAGSPEVEICGLLFGGPDRIDGYQPCANVADRPSDSFEIDPASLIAAFRDERHGGRRMAGCYHSHPSGNAAPSARDAAAAEVDGWIWLIAGGGALAAFCVVTGGALHGRFDAVPIRLTE